LTLEEFEDARTDRSPKDQSEAFQWKPSLRRPSLFSSNGKLKPLYAVVDGVCIDLLQEASVSKSSRLIRAASREYTLKLTPPCSTEAPSGALRPVVGKICSAEPKPKFAEEVRRAMLEFLKATEGGQRPSRHWRRITVWNNLHASDDRVQHNRFWDGTQTISGLFGTFASCLGRDRFDSFA
jgi:hypothetical protein